MGKKFLGLALAGTLVFGVADAIPAQAAVKQTWVWDIKGDCSDYNDMYDEYAMIEDEPDWSCVVWAKVTPASIKRTFYLQYFDNKWKTEDSAKTSTKGYIYLSPDPYNCDSYCDGSYTYRLYSPAASGQKAFTGVTFDITFYPSGTE